MKQVFILIEGTPIAKGRPRFARRGNFVSTYTPKKTADYASLVEAEALVSMAGSKPMEGALSCRIDCYMPIPKSTSKNDTQKMLSGHIHHTKKPDADNIAKNALDPLNKIVFNDDAQIVKLTITKQYSDFPRMEITINEYLKLPAQPK